MGTQVTSEEKLDIANPIIRKKSVTGHNDATLRTVIDCGELGLLVTDEPVPHGGTGDGPSPLQTVLGALCGCESVTFNRVDQPGTVIHTMAFVRAFLAATVFAVTASASAAGFPTRPVRVIVPFTAGSASDILARTVSMPLSVAWEQPVIVDNRPGAGGTIGTGLAAKSPADGHTLVIVSAGHVVNPVMYSSLPYDTLRDFSGVIPLANLPSVLAVSKGGVRSVRELVALAKGKPGQLNYVSGGVGSGSHVNGEKFRAAAGIEVTHVPLKGANDMLTEIISGRVQYGFVPLIAAAPFIRDQKLTALAVSTGKRAVAFPELPTIAEAGVPGAEFNFWIGMLAPARTPRAIVHKLNRDTGNLLEQATIRERLRNLGADPMPMTPEAFDAFLRSEFVELGRVMKAAGVKAE